MRGSTRIRRNESGFTMMELITVSAVLAILAAAAIPAFAVWLPNYRLKTAVRDLYSNMQLVRLTAVKDNTTRSIVFSANPDQYQFFSSGATRTVLMSEYGSGVNFDDPTHGLTFDLATLSFSARGTCDDGTGWVYLSNEKNSAYYRVSPLISGAVSLQKYNGTVFQ
jgi:prepilin-type N-terminal cleavage/methylation domain-containing protein